MNFNTLDDIISHFNFDVKNVDDIKKELKSLLKTVHPDKSNGDFKSEIDKNFFYEIQSATEFLEKLNLDVSLLPQNEITALTKALKDLAIIRKEDTVTESVEKKSHNLTNKLQESITSYHKLNSTPKITGIVATTLITALWAFPSLVKDHPLLKFLYDNNTVFTAVWVSSLIIMGMLWLKINTAEKVDEEIKRSYKLESTQNYIFSLFIKWMMANHINLDIVERKRIITFSKDDLINFLVTRFRTLQVQLSGTESLRSFEIEKEIKLIEHNGDFQRNIYKRRHMFPFDVFTNFFPIPGEIDSEIAQSICDLIIERLNLKGIIVKSETKSLSDKYVYEEDY